jgi:histidinol-phosphate aminotransferase
VSGPLPYFNPPKRMPFALPTPPRAKRLISLAINESACGASPKAIAAAKARADALNRYPDPASNALRRAIGDVHGIDPERIVCGNGSEELLDVVGRMFVRPGDEIVMSQSGFFQFAVVAARLGATLKRAAERDLVTTRDGLAAAVSPNTKLVFLAVPNNPTGTVIPFSEVKAMHAALPPEAMLLLDLAYGEFLPEPDLAELITWGMGEPNVILTRTFSKAYGLAALRIGWMVAPEVFTPGLNMLRGVGNINAIAQAAAEAAVRDQEFMRRAVAETARERELLAQTLTRLGLSFTPGLGNFLLTEVPHAAQFIGYAMAEEGIWLRPVGEPGFAGHIRIGLGTREENELLARVLERFLRLV